MKVAALPSLEFGVSKLFCLPSKGIISKIMSTGVGKTSSHNRSMSFGAIRRSAVSVCASQMPYKHTGSSYG